MSTLSLSTAGHFGEVGKGGGGEEILFVLPFTGELKYPRLYGETKDEAHMDKQTLEFFRREAFNLAVDITDGDKKPVNLTNFIARLTIKTKTTDSDENAKLGPVTGVISDPISGTVIFPITTIDTENINEGKYYFDVVIYNIITSHRKIVSFGEAIVRNGVTINM